MELGEHDRQEVAGNTILTGDGDMPATKSAQIVDLGDGAVEVALEPENVAIEDFAGGGQPDALGKALEQLALQLILELEDLAVDGRRRNVQRFRRLAHRAVPHRLAEIAERDQVDMHERRHLVLELYAIVAPPTSKNRARE